MQMPTQMMCTHLLLLTILILRTLAMETTRYKANLDMWLCAVCQLYTVHALHLNIEYVAGVLYHRLCVTVPFSSSWTHKPSIRVQMLRLIIDWSVCYLSSQGNHD